TRRVLALSEPEYILRCEDLPQQWHLSPGVKEGWGDCEKDSGAGGVGGGDGGFDHPTTWLLVRNKSDLKDEHNPADYTQSLLDQLSELQLKMNMRSHRLSAIFYECVNRNVKRDLMVAATEKCMMTSSLPLAFVIAFVVFVAEKGDKCEEVTVGEKKSGIALPTFFISVRYIGGNECEDHFSLINETTIFMRSGYGEYDCRGKREDRRNRVSWSKSSAKRTG
ncbi:hypothetical protein Tco_0026433, partial [Tanacetum coccineum]